MSKLKQRYSDWRQSPQGNRIAQNGWDYFLILGGSVILAVSMHLFFIPNLLVAGGLSGSAQIINSFTGWPVGTLTFIINIPLFILGWRHLGGRRFLTRTIVSSFIYAAVIDGLEWLAPGIHLTEDLALNALYGGVTAGVGAGLVFRARATSGGTDILARILERRFGMPLSQAYLYTDGLVVFIAGLAFGWERALYAVIGLYVGGVVTEIAVNGSNIMRVATIITKHPEAVAERILSELERGVTDWTGKGMYTGLEKHILLCAVSRAEIVPLKSIIHEADPEAFVIIGQAQEVLGEGFRSLTDQAA